MDDPLLGGAAPRVGTFVGTPRLATHIHEGHMLGWNPRQYWLVQAWLPVAILMILRQTTVYTRKVIGSSPIPPTPTLAGTIKISLSSKGATQTAAEEETNFIRLLFKPGHRYRNKSPMRSRKFAKRF